MPQNRGKVGGGLYVRWDVSHNGVETDGLFLLIVGTAHQIGIGKRCIVPLAIPKLEGMLLVSLGLIESFKLNCSIFFFLDIQTTLVLTSSLSYVVVFLIFCVNFDVHALNLTIYFEVFFVENQDLL